MAFLTSKLHSRCIITNVALLVALGSSLSYGSADLRLLGLLPMSGEGWTGGEAILLPVKLALEDINSNDSILKGYNLTYDFIDSKVG